MTRLLLAPAGYGKTEHLIRYIRWLLASTREGVTLAQEKIVKTGL